MLKDTTFILVYNCCYMINLINKVLLDERLFDVILTNYCWTFKLPVKIVIAVLILYDYDKKNVMHNILCYKI